MWQSSRNRVWHGITHIKEWVLPNVEYLHLLRVPVCTWAFVGLLGSVSDWRLARPLLKNLFEVNEKEAFWIAFFASNACMAGLIAARAICAGASERFHNGRRGPRIGFGTGGMLCALPYLALMQHLQTPVLIYAISASLLANGLLCLGAGWVARFRIPSFRYFPGYSEDFGARRHMFRREHVLSLAVLGVYLVVFLIVSAYRARTLFTRGLPGQTINNGPPTLAFLFAAAAFICLLLSAFTFFLDRYRIPLTALGLLLLLLTSWRGNGDHFFRVSPRTSLRPSARDILSVPGKVILVAASGGGIQASAWTARVLTGLTDNDTFSRSVRVISAVSGGSLGTLCFARTFASGSQTGRPWTQDEALRASMMSSLDSIAYGLVRYDLPRILFFDSYGAFDRGWALENTISRRSELESTSLSDWARHAGKDMPAVIFNATGMETGTPLVFSTTTMPIGSGIVDFTATEDLGVATAVRMSATFPFVSPAARPRSSTLLQHVGDGGYYDNSGIDTLISWFDEGVEHRLSAKPMSVLLLRISAFPPSNQTPLRTQSWIYDLVSPFDALMGVRSTSQLAHGDGPLKRLKSLTKITYVHFQYSTRDSKCKQPSLSWNMNLEEQQCIEQAWSEMGVEKETVKHFLLER